LHGGTLDKSRDPAEHEAMDIKPWYACCEEDGEDSENCKKYYERRPSVDDVGYTQEEPYRKAK
jgi:hypothetical protein